MPCPHRSETPDESETGSRRSFLKAAVAIGGANALAACTTGQNEPSVTEPGDEPKYPRGPDDLETLPNRQHAWGRYLPTNRQNQLVFPQHQVFVFLDYTGTTPTEAERDRVERAFRTVERAFQRGAGSTGDPMVVDGLLFSVGYAPSYFDRFDASLPESAGMMRPQDLLDALDEDPGLADGYDAVIHLGSDVAEVVLGAEEALFGAVDTLNGIPVEGTLSDAFERVERRSGLIGSGLPAERVDEDISPKAPIPMGFKSAFEDTLPSEDRMTIAEGPFAGGTTQHISQLVERLSEWYDEDHTDRIEKMFGPTFTESEVGEAGERLGNFSGVSEEQAASVPDAAAEHGRVGHSQKLARARDDDFNPVILRRGDFFQAGEAETVLNFGSIQRDLEAFVRTRRAMSDLAFEESETEVSLPPAEDGILDYIRTRSRATFLIPPRELRALPSPRPDR